MGGEGRGGGGEERGGVGEGRGGEGRGGGGEERGGEGVLGLVVGVQIVRMGQEERRENVQMEGPK